MSLAEYFENTMGIGVLATADSKGKVDAAIYARPHVIDETTVAFIMSDKLSHSNLATNPCAAYLFIEKGQGYIGKRLYLTKVREETDPAIIDAMRRKQRQDCPVESEHKYLVFFRVNEVRPLTGSK
ncbi:MAG: pyridoxamine 5'-phosphate oxidase family protein [Sedimentisphaerales bacterium]|nr:pyridoxamine 5'-phosphate oxidase family protein [Sedimentisphaerales bacterium]